MTITRLALPLLLATSVAWPAVGSARQINLRDDMQLAAATDGVIKQNHLSNRPNDCVDFAMDKSNSAYTDVKVLERHNAKCGGDPQVEPTLFTVRFRLRDQAVFTDKGSTAGRFRRLAFPH